jgi:alkanesulfonate monooxygenase SsuD/methylene tetrahydromethanopterin reductase-like flavin-dependent oxidoreductase (luciferase family)
MSLATELPGRALPGPPPDFAAYARLARTAERGLFDFVLLTDTPGRAPGGDDSGPHAYALPGGRPEPLTVLHALAGITTHIGLALLASPGGEPYDLARAVAALDRLSGGRAAGPPVDPLARAAPPGPRRRPVVIRDADPERPEDGADGGAFGNDAGDIDSGGTGGADVVVGRPGQRPSPGVKLLARLSFTLTEPAAAPILAEQLDAPVQSGALDGYVLLPEPAPGGRGLDAFVDLVAPLLRARGSLRTAYRGTTLRDHLGLPRPV